MLNLHVDIWKNQNENYKNVNFDNVEKRFDENLANYKKSSYKI